MLVKDHACKEKDQIHVKIKVSTYAKCGTKLEEKGGDDDNEEEQIGCLTNFSTWCILHTYYKGLDRYRNTCRVCFLCLNGLITAAFRSSEPMGVSASSLHREY